MSGILAFCQWALGAGFWRFAGAVVLIVTIPAGLAQLVVAFAHVIAAFRRVR